MAMDADASPKPAPLLRQHGKRDILTVLEADQPAVPPLSGRTSYSAS